MWPGITRIPTYYEPIHGFACFMPCHQKDPILFEVTNEYAFHLFELYQTTCEPCKVSALLQPFDSEVAKFSLILVPTVNNMKKKCHFASFKDLPAVYRLRSRHLSNIGHAVLGNARGAREARGTTESLSRFQTPSAQYSSACYEG